MIKRVTATNYLNESIEMELARPEKSGFAITKITGLEPVKATINTTALSTNDGAVYNSARTNYRNIVLYLAFLWSPSIEDMRQLSYKYFPVKKPVTLAIETDNRICQTTGYVESNEVDIFSGSETTQISIICPDPYFYSAGKDSNNVTVFNGIEELFEFPFPDLDQSNDDFYSLEFGNLQSAIIKTIWYEGDAEIGVLMTINALGPATNITIYNTQTQDSMAIDTTKLEQLTGAGITAGDEITISTVRGNKYVRLLRKGVYTNILNCLNKDADWFLLSKGDNVFAYTAETGSENIQFRMENKTLYEGV